ncbi:hypothetical protein BB559_005121 [Furculomyces boomerangus]|uniref:EamA domain-containing protein n=1 Tax=Furculomyces boomerangus TaxID=61424 RepID=A0A2T9YAR1_9FUNG|nr:hypothetical protein BB559_005121 [Furculomyces boomerangus]
MSKTIIFAIFGGFFASTASLFAKLAVDESALRFSLYFDRDPQTIKLFFHGVMVLLLVLSNSLMWLFFSKALSSSGSGSTVYVTAIQNLVNFSFTALYGTLIFHKSVGLKWWLGVSFIASGLAIISRQDPETKKSSEKEKPQEKKDL